MDKILLGLFVALTGSLLLPAMQLARIIVPRRARQVLAGRETISDVKGQIDHVPLAPAARAEGFEFLPLTAEEKKEFGNSLAAKGKPSSSRSRVYLPGLTIVP